MIAFGPVPSRRLGFSLGINNIPPKTCSYACVYCQLGRTDRMRVVRQPFYLPEEIEQAAREKVEDAAATGQRIDYVALVPDGEPTLDIHLGREIELLERLGLPVAVITNGSLIDRKDVREDLLHADWVSLKVDAVREGLWRAVDCPQGTLRLDAILDGMRAFAATHRGTLVTETMLVAGLNDGEEDVAAVAAFLAELRPSCAYLSAPTRPPAERWVKAPDEAVINRAYHAFSDRLERVELLTGYEGNAFASSGDPEADLLSITAVHPMREDAVADLLRRSGSEWALVQSLIERDELVELAYGGRRFYLRRLRRSA